MNNNKLIIAGADGYIGQRIQKSIAGNERMLLLSPKEQENYIHFDLMQVDKFNFDLITQGDTVVILAAISSPDFCNKCYKISFDVNVLGTIRFTSECIRRGARVLFFSSDTVYGSSPEENHEDILPEDPTGDYGKMKLSVEKYFRGEASFKAFRLSYVFSWHDKFTRYLRECLWLGKSPEIFDPLIRKAVYIEDLISCIINISREWNHQSSQFFNICGPQYLSRLEIADLFSIHVGKLDVRVIRPGKDFYKARPEKISISSKYSNALLGREFTTLENALKIEMELFAN